MTVTQLVERQIVNELLQRAAPAAAGAEGRAWAGRLVAGRLIKGLAAAAILVVLGAWVPGIVWLALGAATALALGVR